MLENELKEYLKSLGAALVGFADLSGIHPALRNDLNYGIAFAVRIKPVTVENINGGPTEEYYKEYNEINQRLDDIADACVKYIREQGYNAVGQTSTYVTEDSNLSTPLPHKTVATRAGLGWIGKNALLITPEYGSAVRISSVITDMPLSADTPINESKCGSCTKCADACPASAVKGVQWKVSSTREELIDAVKCRKKARELLKQNIGIEMSLCGKCIEVCPFTKRYTKSVK